MPWKDLRAEIEAEFSELVDYDRVDPIISVEVLRIQHNAEVLAYYYANRPARLAYQKQHQQRQSVKDRRNELARKRYGSHKPRGKYRKTH